MNPVVMTARNFVRSFTFSNIILFVPCIVIIITYIYQQMQTIYIKLQIVHMCKLSFIFQR